MKENQVGYRSDVDDKHSEANSIHFIEFLSHSKISSGHQKFHDTLMCFEYFLVVSSFFCFSDLIEYLLFFQSKSQEAHILIGMQDYK